MPPARLFCAVDVDDLAAACRLARSLVGLVDGLKLGLEFFCAEGPDGVHAVQAEATEAGGKPIPIFLDLKLHDIPNTVRKAARSAAALGVDVMTIHAGGGPAMVRAAAEGAAEGAARAGLLPPHVVAVTVLTSMTEDDLAAVGQRGPVGDQVRRLATMTLDAGGAGVVCSAREAAMLRATLGPKALLVTPGLRPTWAAADDQARIVTPGEAARLGADLLVVGRPITAAADPADAARRIRDEIRAAGRA